MRYTKQDLDNAIARYKQLEKEMIRVEEKKTQAETELKEVQAEILTLTKGFDLSEAISKLEKELETRMQLIEGSVREFEQILADVKLTASKKGDEVDLDIDLDVN
jgi:predicted  nucleic acid-binding Zn-ribbon protein